MSEQKNENVGHLSGLSPSGNGETLEELQGSIKAFSRPPGDEPIPHREGDSDSDLQGATPETVGKEGFVSADQHPVYDAIRENPPKIAHEDAEVLERQRVDQDDEIVAVYDPSTDSEKAELRPRATKKGAESEGL